MEWAINLGWYDSAKFSLADYQYYERVENGDLNWIIPGKFVAFSTPVDPTHGVQDFSFSPDYYVPIFKKLGVTMVVRLNTKEYDREVSFLMIIRLEIREEGNQASGPVLSRWQLSDRGTSPFLAHLLRIGQGG